MNVTKQLRDLGHITRQILGDGTLRRYIGDFYITGLTSHPTNDQAGIEEKSGASVRA